MQRKCCNATKSSRWNPFALWETGKIEIGFVLLPGCHMGPSVAVVVVAAGRGIRAGGTVPKQYRPLAGEPMIRASLSLFSWHGEIGAVQTVIHPDDKASYEAAAVGLRLLPPVLGGATRQASVRAGLEALSGRAPDIVLVHDAARPFCSTELVFARRPGRCRIRRRIPALEVTDTIKQVDADGHVVERSTRAKLRSVQTPQAFAFPALLEAHRRAAKEGREDFTDDASARRMGRPHGFGVFRARRNVKMDHRRGLCARRGAAGRKPAGPSHRHWLRRACLADGDHVWLGASRSRTTAG